MTQPVRVVHTIAFGATGGTSAAIDTTGVTFIAISATFLTSTAGSIVISDSKGNTYVLGTDSTTSTISNRGAYANASTGAFAVGAGHTFTIAGGAGSLAEIVVSCYSGIVTTAPLDVAEVRFTSSGSNVTSIATGTGVPASQGDLCIVMLSNRFATISSLTMDWALTQADLTNGSGFGAYLWDGLINNSEPVDVSLGWTTGVPVCGRMWLIKATDVGAGGGPSWRHTSAAGADTTGATWNGGVVPANFSNTTFAIRHAVTSTTSRTLGSGTTANMVTIYGPQQGATGSWTQNGGTLTQNCGILLQDGALIINQPASFVNNDATYLVTQSLALAQTASRVEVHGTAGARVSVTKLVQVRGNALYGAGVTAEYADFVDCFDGSNAFLSINTLAGSTLQKPSFSHCTFTNCGIVGGTVAADTDVLIEFCKEINPRVLYGSGFAWQFNCAAATTGQRLFQYNNFSTNVLVQTSMKGFTFKHSTIGYLTPNTLTEFTAPTIDALVTLFGALLPPGGTSTRLVHFSMIPSSASFAVYTAAGAPGATTTLDNYIEQTMASSELSDGVSSGGNSENANQIVRMWRGIDLMNAIGGSSSGICAEHGSKYIFLDVRRATKHLTTVSPGAIPAMMGAGYFGHAGEFQRFENSLLWSPAPLTAGTAIGLVHYGNSPLNLDPLNSNGIFTSTATSTQSLIKQATAGWKTLVDQTLADAVASLIVLANGGSSDLTVNQIRAITANTAGSITVSPAFSGTVSTGASFRPKVDDQVVSGMYRNNGYYNGALGTNWNKSTFASFTVLGLSGFWLDPATITTIRDLGSGSDPYGAGPMFKAAERDLVTFDQDKLIDPSTGLHYAVATAWSSGVPVTAGTVRSTSIGATFGARSPNYIALQDHTTGASTKPGDNSVTWTNHWRVASFDRIGISLANGETFTDATLRLNGDDPTLTLSAGSAVDLLFSWIRDAKMPMSTACRAVSIGGTIPDADFNGGATTLGAVEYMAGPTPPSTGKRRRRGKMMSWM